LGSAVEMRSLYAAFAEPVTDSIPSTPSLPWRSESVTRAHVRSFARTFVLQIRPFMSAMAAPTATVRAGSGGVPNPQAPDKAIPPLSGQDFRTEFNTDQKIIAHPLRQRDRAVADREHAALGRDHSRRPAASACRLSEDAQVSRAQRGRIFVRVEAGGASPGRRGCVYCESPGVASSWALEARPRFAHLLRNRRRSNGVETVDSVGGNGDCHLFAFANWLLDRHHRQERRVLAHDVDELLVAEIFDDLDPAVEP
jgi:hypothetical protein